MVIPRFWGHDHCHSVPPRRRQTSAAAQPPRRGHSLPPRAEASYLGPGGVKIYGARFTRSVLCKNKQDDMTAMSQDRGAMKSAGKGPICDITQMAGNSSIILFFFPMWRLMLRTISIFSHQSDRTSNCSTSEPHQAPTFQGSGHIYCRHPLWLSQQSTSQPRQRGRSAPPNAALCRLGRAQWVSVGKGLGPVVPTENAKTTWKREDSFKNKTLFRCTRPFPYDHLITFEIRPHRRCWGVIVRMALVKGYRFTWGGGAKTSCFW